jgi:hypothetical protein
LFENLKKKSNQQQLSLKGSQREATFEHTMCLLFPLLLLRFSPELQNQKTRLVGSWFLTS